ncbi:restriction endonuclease subunit S [Vibrio parahaemolyticus]|nr:restriction endonuclease subunit S [Vibrio parahaemolyticus]KOF26135.1 restriction endonuclease [Vibrio parahaemolyticus]MBM5017732.1 restriction endonuclease subunit S [Vibrio parahaemolyticus]MBM5127321.1 restriction endonuclease subunit S [Vibrio parahaemolyticus]OAR40847.1 restriction endonuclease [Vibrio parahaemolyticus]ODW90998.1 restriction endonuclease [Vibrio parahaemolyticus]
MLGDVEWGKFKFKDIFNNIAQGRRLKKDDQIPGSIPFVMAGITNTGVVNYISNPVASFPKNSITVDIFGNVFYRDYAFGAGDDTGVYWSTNYEYTRNSMLFFTISMSKSLEGKFDYGNKLRSSKSLNLEMSLPVKEGKIDFDFMEKFIAELEAEQMAKLDAYMSAAGLKDTQLTPVEQEVLDDFDGGRIDWGNFNLKELFGKSTRGKRLKSSDRIEGNLPFVTAGEADEGVSAFIGNSVTIFSNNTTTIDMFGSAKYRNYKYGGDDHVAVVHTEKLSKHAAIFVTTSIHKSSYTGKFDYGRNFYAKDADELNISLPQKDNKPNYYLMDILVSAIHKLVIRDVIEYAEEKYTHH